MVTRVNTCIVVSYYTRSTVCVNVAFVGILIGKVKTRTLTRHTRNNCRTLDKLSLWNVRM